MTPILGLIAFVVWIYILRVIHKSQLPAWEFVWGSCGIFVFMILFIRPYCTQPLAQTVAAIAGCFGKITGMFTSYFKYGVIFVNSDAGAITLQIDFECSGILEIMAYLSLLLFFRAYTNMREGSCRCLERHISYWPMHSGSLRSVSSYIILVCPLIMWRTLL